MAIEAGIAATNDPHQQYELVRNLKYQRNDTEGDDAYLKSFPESSPWRKAAVGKLVVQEKEVVYSVQSLLTVLKSCSMRRDLQWGRRIHSKAVESRHDSNVYVVTALISMYTKCGSMVDANRVFVKVQKPDVISWTALLVGYVENGEGLVALEFFSKMKACGCVPNCVTYIAALKACSLLAGQCQYLKQGREIHSEIGCNLNIFVKNTLIDMYSNFGSMVEARMVFNRIQQPAVVSWNALLLGYVENGEGLVTLDLFSEMKACRCEPNSVTYVAALKACTSLVKGAGSGYDECLTRGREIHSEVGCYLNIFVQNTLIDMYTKCGSMIDARSVFDSIKKPDVVSWNALLLGYVENEDGVATLELFSKMKAFRCTPDSVTYVAALKACGLIGALALGRRIHSDISKFNGHLVTCLVDFYAKCGSMVEAREVFDWHSTARLVSTWNALLSGYSILGDTDFVFKLFDVMQDEGFQPNAITFVCMLSCCSHAGLIEKAREFLEAMPLQYGVTPTVMHYNCMVDVLGRANLLNEAISMSREMPCSPDSVTWMTLLGACCKWKNVEIGRCAFQSLIDMMGKKSVQTYALMAHIYGSRGMWEEQERVWEEQEREFGKIRNFHGQAYVIDEVGNPVKFEVVEEDSPEVKNKLEQLLQRMEECEYVAESFSIRCNVGDTEKEVVVVK